MLAKNPIGERAIADRALLEDVVVVKTRFYNSGTARYDQCLNGKAKLIPDAGGLTVLRADYNQMVASGMLDNSVPFDDLIDTVSQLQSDVNTKFQD